MTKITISQDGLLTVSNRLVNEEGVIFRMTSEGDLITGNFNQSEKDVDNPNLIMKIGLGGINLHGVLVEEGVVPTEPIADGLLLHYDFRGRSNEDAERTIINDLSGNGNHGLLNNFVFEGLSGYTPEGLSYEGATNYISTPLKTANLHGVNNDITFSLTLSHRDLLINDVPIMANMGGAQRFHIATRANGVMGIGILSWATNTTKMFNVGEIYHITVVISNGVGKVYKNGKLFFTHLSEVIGTPSPTNSLQFGGIEQHVRRGTTCSAMIYNRALSESEISHNYKFDSAVGINGIATP